MAGRGAHTALVIGVNLSSFLVRSRVWKILPLASISKTFCIRAVKASASSIE